MNDCVGLCVREFDASWVLVGVSEPVRLRDGDWLALTDALSDDDCDDDVDGVMACERDDDTVAVLVELRESVCVDVAT